MCVNRIVAEPWRQCFAVSPVDIGESEDPLTEEELDLVQGYMDQPFHDWGNQREGKGQDKAWWEVDSIVSGSYDGNTLVKRVLDDMLKVLPWVVEGAGGLGAGKTSGAGTRGVSLDVVIGGRTGYSNTNGGESSDNRSKVHADCGPAENPSL